MGGKRCAHVSTRCHGDQVSGEVWSGRDGAVTREIPPARTGSVSLKAWFTAPPNLDGSPSDLARPPGHLFLIVAVPCRGSPRIAFTGADRLTKNVSSGSGTASLYVLIEIVWEIVPAARLTVASFA